MATFADPTPPRASHDNPPSQYSRRQMLRLSGLGLSSLAVPWATGCSSGTSGGSQPPIRIGTNNWTENVAVSHMWKVLLEERGYQVHIKQGAKAPLYTGVADGDLDLSLEVWLPHGDATYHRKYKEDWTKYGPWYQDARLGLVVPSYLSIDSLSDLGRNAEKFNGRIVGIEAGSSIMELAKQAMQTYELDYEVVTSSTQAMLAELDAAYTSRKPIVVTLWNPHWAWSQYDLTYLQDPRQVFGKTDDIYFVTREGFAEDYPKVLKWMRQWELSHGALRELMESVRKAKKPNAGARAWIKDNRTHVQRWFDSST